jgi:hypothetical protein
MQPISLVTLSFHEAIHLTSMKFLRLLTISLIIFISWNSCVYNDLSPEHDLKIELRWVKSYPTQTQDEVITGLAWTLSFLGAELPAGSLQRAFHWQGTHFTLDISQVGFDLQAQAAFKELIDFLKRSDEYSIQGGIDLGRFVMLTLNSTNHYYAITGTPDNYSAFRAQYNFDDKKAAIIISSIAFGNRLIELSTGDQLSKVAFIATEGQGSLIDGTFEAEEFEAMNFMENGQLRFALYDINGNLKTSASPSLTAAGKPAKCLWCHEIRLQPPGIDDHELLGYYTADEFRNKLDERSILIENHRAGLGSDIDFSKIQDHTKAELLYLAFMEPSAERLADEWGVSVSEVKDKLGNISTHRHHEFPFLGDALYHRKDVDDFAPYQNIAVPEDPRELSQYEPDFIH